MHRALAVGLALAIVAVCASGTRVALAQQTAAGPEAGPGGSTLSPERDARLRARVASWHEARILRDQRAMYDLLDPGYRARVDFGTYAQQTTLRLRFSLLKFEVASVQPMSDDQVTVVVNLRVDLGRFGENLVPATDTWVWREGDWWLVFKEVELPFPKSDPAP